MRTSAGMSSDFVSPTSGCSSRPSAISSAAFWMYSCARWTGLRVWKPTTRFQPRSANAARVCAGSRRYSGNVGFAGRRKTCTGPPMQDVVLRVDGGDAGVLVLGRAVDLVGLVRLVVVEVLLDGHDRERRAIAVGQRDLALEAVGLLLRDAERDRDRPRQAAGQVHGVDDALVLRLRHEAVERAEAAVGEQLEVGQLARVEAARRQALRLLLERRASSPVTSRGLSLPPCGAISPSRVPSGIVVCQSFRAPCADVCLRSADSSVARRLVDRPVPTCCLRYALTAAGT